MIRVKVEMKKLFEEEDSIEILNFLGIINNM